MRRHLYAAALSSLILATTSSAVHARSDPWAGQRLVPETFRLQLAGPVDSDITFWVAYGPLAGKFGLFRLRGTGDGAVAATVRLPAGARGTFSFIAGHGVQRTRFGPAPGDPVVAIRDVGPARVSALHTLRVSWHPPVG